MSETLFGLDVFASTVIYKDFVSGKMINDYEIVHDELQPSAKFRELVDHLDTYRQLYALLGFEIRTLNNQAFFVTRDDTDEEYSELAANIQVILTVIARGLYGLGLGPGMLTDPSAGLSAEQINQIGEMEQQNTILKACGIRLPLVESVNVQLVNRGIMFKTKNERYVLSSAGKYLFEEISVQPQPSSEPTATAVEN